MKDLTEGKLESAKTFAKSIGTDTLEWDVKHLEEMDKLYPQETEISNDFAPHSFYFERTSLETGRMVGNGGIIFSDPSKGLGNGNAPSFSVSIDNDKTAHWSIHT